MDLFNTMELKCEPEVILKYEPLVTEQSYDATVNIANIVKTECESLSFSSSDYGSCKRDCKCSFCMRMQLATLLPTTNPGFNEEFTAWAQGQENTENLVVTSNCTQENLPIDIPTPNEDNKFLDFDSNDFDIEPLNSMKLESEEEHNTDYQSTVEMSVKDERKPFDNSIDCQSNSENNMRQTEPKSSKNRNINNSASCNQTGKPNTGMKTRYYCPYCNRNFTRRDSFSIHLSRRHSKKDSDVLVEKFDKKYSKCDICEFKASCSRSLKSHMLTHDKFVDTNKFKCHNCDYETSNKSNLRVHIRSKHSNHRRTYSCRFCIKTFCNKKSLADHLLTRHDDNFDKSLKTILSRTIKHCKLCDFRVVNQSMLNSHIQVKHSNDRPAHTCRFCNTPLYSKGSLVDHLLCVHGDKFDKSLKTLLSRTIKHCNSCDFRVHSKRRLIDHIRSRHSNNRPTYSCRFCNKALIEKTSLVDHLLCHHGDKFDKSLNTLLGQTINRCKVCDFRVARITRLDLHMTTHSDSPVKPRMYTEILKCNDCVYETCNKFNLRVHIERKHSNGRPRFSCRFCNRTLFYKTSLADHLLFRHGDKFDKSLNTLFSQTIKHCKLCDFRTTTKIMLNRHMTKHVDGLVKAGKDTTLFKCYNCVYETFEECNLRAHIQKMHSNDRRKYSCRICNKTLVKKESLANHLLWLHGDKFDKSLTTILKKTIKHCKLCDFRTISKGKLNRHMATHGQ